jgi:diguanylate cyclase
VGVERGRLVLAGLLAALVPVTAFQLTGGHPARIGVEFGASLVAAASPVVGMRLYGITHRRPWWLLVAGTALESVTEGLTFARVGLGADQPWVSGLVNPLALVGYACLLAGVLGCVLRHAPTDPGGLLDAAVIGIGAAAPTWELLIRPSLRSSHLAGSDQLALLIQLLAMFGALGSLLRMTRLNRSGRTAIWLLVAAAASGIAGQVTGMAAGWTADPGRFPAATTIWTDGYLMFAAGALHPTARRLTHPDLLRRDRLSEVRLGFLGVFLAMMPLMGGLPQLAGRPPDGLLLVFGPLLITPLVLARIRQLVVQQTRDQERLAHLAHHDELTGLVNRGRTLELLQQAVDRHAAGGLDAVTVLFCDLDRLKPINDGLGHDAGDAALRATAARLSGAVRADDVVGRIGGDEFLVVCPGLTLDSARPLAERLVAAVDGPVEWRGARLPLGVTIGTATLADQQLSADELVARADIDMYTRKHSRPPAATAPGAGASTDAAWAG